MALNKTNIRKVALAVLNTQKRGKTQIGYNQLFIDTNGVKDRSGHECGTVACIGGHAALLAGARFSKDRGIIDGNPLATARKYLGLTKEQADDLFPAHPQGKKGSIFEVTAQEAALVLFNLAETGKVDWSLVEAGRAINAGI